MGLAHHVHAAAGTRPSPVPVAARRWPLHHSRLPLLRARRRAAPPRRTTRPALPPDAAPAVAPAAQPLPGAAAAPAPPHGAPPPPAGGFTLQVTRSNFADALSRARAALRDCHFFAFDCEMTGLTLDGQEDKLLDDAFDRHERTVAAAQQFLILQFGLAAFIWRGDDGSSGGGSGGGKGGGYEAQTFNFYLFPSPRGDFDLRFSCQASSIAFLASQGFDFNKMIYEGVPFLPLSKRDKLLADAQQALRKQATPVVMDDLADDEERLFARQLTEKVNAWLAGGEPTLEVPRVGPAYAKLQEQLLAAGPFQLPPGAEAPGFFVDYSGDAGGAPGVGGAGGGASQDAAPGAPPAPRGMVLVLRRAAPGEVAAAAAASDQALRSRADDAAGFSSLFEAMRDSGKPAVAHNMRYDLAFALQQFVGPLPAGWQEYKALAAKWFPGGLYDTKHLAAQVLGDEGQQLLSDTSLGGLYDTLVQSKKDGELRAWAASRAAATPSPAAWGEPPPAPPPAACGSGGSGGGAAHEAGYDAYMTGAVFGRLLWLLALGGLQGRNKWLIPQEPPAPLPVSVAEEHAWRMPFPRSRDCKSVSLLPGSPDPAPQRPAVFHLQLRSQGRLRWGMVQAKFRALGLGQVYVSMLPSNRAAYVQLQQPDRAPAVVPTLSARWKDVVVAPYSEHYLQKASASALGSGGVQGGGSGGGVVGRGAGSASSSAGGSPLSSAEEAEGDGADGGGGGRPAAAARRPPQKLAPAGGGGGAAGGGGGGGGAATAKSMADSMAALAQQAKRMKEAAEKERERRRREDEGRRQQAAAAAGAQGGNGGGALLDGREAAPGAPSASGDGSGQSEQGEGASPGGARPLPESEAQEGGGRAVPAPVAGGPRLPPAPRLSGPVLQRPKRPAPPT